MDVKIRAAAVGLLLALLSPLVVSGSPSSAYVPESTTTVISVNPTVATYPGVVTFSVVITGPTFPQPSAAEEVTLGQVTFTSGAIPICIAPLAEVGNPSSEITGSCSTTTGDLPLGLQTINGSYSGGGAADGALSESVTFLASSGTTFLTVGDSPTTTSVSVNPASTTSGSTVTYTAKVSSNGGIPTGSVEFYVGTLDLCGASLTNGLGSCTSTNAPVGAPDIIASGYSGSATFLQSTGYAYLTVDVPAPPKTNQAPLTITSTSGAFGTPLTLTTIGGSGTGAVSYVSVDGSATGCAVALDGTLNATSAGTCIVVATKAGDATYNAASSLPTTVALVAPTVTPVPPVASPAPPNPVTPTPTPTPPVVTSPSSTGSHGYWLVGSDGGIFTYGDAAFYGSTGNLRLQRPVVGITPTAGDLGYWLGGIGRRHLLLR